MSRIRNLVSAVVLSTASLACAQPATTELDHENLMATLWVQHAAEYAGVTRSLYAAATAQLDAALADRELTAAVEQQGADVTGLPPAIILDVDETVLDNSVYQARLILDGRSYETESWTAWCEERAATPIDGSLEFIRAAADRGVTVFYVTNRNANVDAATADNLRALGYPVDEDHVLTRYEREEWTSDKTSRRAYVARTHRIVMMFGDNLGDFVDIEEADVAARDALVAEHTDRWGSSWFMFPNPMYGSWDGVLIENDWGAPRDERIERKRAWLEREGH